ncbi:MAG: hypothetical protein IJM96_06005, partial [Clostridia bacterium]|nr:hypothetical protein [Clostridia bacterium]
AIFRKFHQRADITDVFFDGGGAFLLKLKVVRELFNLVPFQNTFSHTVLSFCVFYFKFNAKSGVIQYPGRGFLLKIGTVQPSACFSVGML